MQIGQPTLNSPQNDQSIDPTANNTFTFTQQSDYNIKKYIIRIFRYTDDQNVYDSGVITLGTQITQQSHTVPQNTLENLMEYYWKQMYWDSSDNQSEWSSYNKFVQKIPQQKNMKIKTPTGEIQKIRIVNQQDQNDGVTNLRINVGGTVYQIDIVVPTHIQQSKQRVNIGGTVKQLQKDIESSEFYTDYSNHNDNSGYLRYVNHNNTGYAKYDNHYNFGNVRYSNHTNDSVHSNYGVFYGYIDQYGAIGYTVHNDTTTHTNRGYIAYTNHNNFGYNQYYDHQNTGYNQYSDHVNEN